MANTVGSQEVIPNILRARKNLVLSLTQEEFDVLIGTIIGDSYITKKGRVQIEHGANQEAYLMWKYKKLCKVVSSSVLCTQRKNKELLREVTTSYRFWSKQYFRPWRDIFYPQGKKVIPKIIDKVMSPLVMAVWYMDDGYLRKGKGLCICTDSFTPEDLLVIQTALVKKYSIRTTVVSRGRLHLGVKDSKLFFEIIKPFIIPSMRYKLP